MTLCCGGLTRLRVVFLFPGEDERTGGKKGKSD